METNKRFWNRVGWVEIADKNGNMVKYGGSHDGLDFKFEGKKIGDVNFIFTVGILGLSRETINELAVWDLRKSISDRRKIVVYAGYEGDELKNPIFTGFIQSAIPTNPPEMWLNFTCLPMLNKGEMINFDASEDGETVGTIIEQIAFLCGKGFGKWYATDLDQSTESKMTVSCKISKLFNEYMDKYHVRVVVEGDTVNVYNYNPQLDNPDENVKLISTEYGMLGVSNIDMLGAMIKNRLCDCYALMDWVELKSVVFSNANGKYRVFEKKFSGQYRGDDWSVELRLIRHMAKI